MSAQMARLNEAPVMAENIESLKRKFMRQNRDIARANSNQSLRIRNLENEMSRLLAENLDLREHNVRLQQELDIGEAQRAASHVASLKTQLESKLLELGELVSGLGIVPAAEERLSTSRRASRTSLNESPDQKSWKAMCALSQVVSGQDGKMPTILENKCYPRRTFERQELQEIVADAQADTTDSPEIGPPPVSQFVDEDPLKIDLPVRTKRDNQQHSAVEPTLSANLEHRRKRKDSVVLDDTKKSSILDPSQLSTRSLKTGAKRKLSVREDEETSLCPGKASNISPDKFQSARVSAEERSRNKISDQSEKLGGNVGQDFAASKGVSQSAHPTTNQISTNRKALAPKSINDSPRKATKNTILDKVKSTEEGPPKLNLVKDRAKDKRQHEVIINPPNQLVAHSVEVQPEPATPAALDIFSPMSSQPSTTHTELRDTPPPAELGSGNEAHRPSRRARASVSYAEPNLRDKMRRPTKELVDAVTRDDKANRGSSVKLEEDVPPSNIKIKAEPESEDAWRSIPSAAATTVENSPLSNKGIAPETLSSNITSHRKRRESILAQNETDLSRLGSRNLVAALSAEVVAAKRNDNKESIPTVSAPSVDAYEFKGSSPVAEAAPTRPRKEGFVSSRFSKRISAVATDTVCVESQNVTDVGSQRTAPASTTSGRRQSMLGVRNTSSDVQLIRDTDKEKMLKRALSITGIGEAESTLSRNERVSARRRSMML